MHKSAWILLAALALGAAFMLWFSGARQEPAAIPSMLPPQSPEAPELESPAATSARVESAPVAAAAQSEEHVPSIHGSNEVDAFELALSKRDLSQEDWGTTTLDFEKAEAYAKDPKFNPAGVELGPEEMQRLQRLIGRLNLRLRLNHEDVGRLTSSHIQEKIDRGPAIIVTDGTEPDRRSLGEGGIPICRCQAGASYYVKIQKGDFADLDHAQYQGSAIVHLGEEWIARAFQ